MFLVRVNLDILGVFGIMYFTKPFHFTINYSRINAGEVAHTISAISGGFDDLIMKYESIYYYLFHQIFMNSNKVTLSAG